MSIHAPALILLAVLPCSLSAQIPPQEPEPVYPWDNGQLDPCLPFEPQNTIERQPLIGTPTTFGRIVIAELDGDQAPDGVAIEDGEAVAFWRLAVYDAAEVIEFPTKAPPTDVADIAVLPGGSPEGRDAVLMTDARGLFLVWWSNGRFQDPKLIAAGDWIDAAPIHVDDLDSLDGLDVLGISANQRKILTLLDDDGEFEVGTTVNEPVQVREVVPVDWNNDGTRELAALAMRKLFVHDGGSGAVIEIVPYISTTGCLARFRASAAGEELLAWTRGTSTGVSQLAVYGGGTLQETWDLTVDVCGTSTDIHPTAVVAGDYDQNGTDELLLVHQANRTAIVLGNQGPTSEYFFLPHNGFAYDVIPLSPDEQETGGVGIPAFGQLDDLDPEIPGPLDLVFPVSATARVEVFLNPGYMRALQTTPVTSATIVSNLTEFGLTQALDARELHFAFVVPAKYKRYHHLELIFWHQEDEGSTISDDAVSYRLHDLAITDDPEEGLIVDPHTQWVRVVGAFPLQELCWDPEKPYYYTEYRFVKDVGSTEVKSPIYTGGFTLEDCTGDPDYGYLEFQGIPGSSFALNQDNGLTHPEPLSRNQVGLYVPMSSNPPFADGARPWPGTRYPGGNAEVFNP